MSIFSDTLKKLREDSNLTQTELSKQLEKFNIKTSPQNISYWEKGRQPPFEAIIALSKIFNVSIDFLVGATPYKTLEEKIALDDITDLSDEIIDQRIVNTLINLKKILNILKQSNSDYFEDYIRFLSISKEYFLAISSLCLDLEEQILDNNLKKFDLNAVNELIKNNQYKFREIDDIYFHLTNFLSSLSMDYKSNVITHAIHQLTLSLNNVNDK
ncbi:hypothetical protein C7M56_18190 [Clostridium botulinum]|uniref:HTH cro/C1-type domain-containing protein n=1 Tax=Clostridium botulinum TaxID=1491 RepID=A0ABC8CYP0_CLOBO|nr:helix-turn-helix domain-containing protein [Clostridium botulinum]AVQ40504.1 hypothetical protein C7M56_18190 [Clostridium botulinum]